MPVVCLWVVVTMLNRDRFIKMYDFGFFGVNFYTRFIAPGLAGVEHALELVRATANEYNVVHVGYSS